MYQRIVIYTRLFRERWSNKCILSSLWDGTCTGDAACNPTLGCERCLWANSNHKYGYGDC